MDDMLEDRSSSRPAAPQRTYGRSRAVADDNDSPLTAILLAPPPPSTATASASKLASPSTTLLERFSAKSTNWRESLVELDASHNEVETEAEIQAARERFRNDGALSNSRTSAAGPSSKRVLAAFSSSTLTDPPSSTPRKAPDVDLSSPPTSPAPRKPASISGSPHLASAEVESTDGDASGTIPTQSPRALANRDASTPPSPPSLVHQAEEAEEEADSLDEDSSSTPQQSSSRRIKGYNKNEAEQAHRDAARALRERQAELSRPEPTRRPVTEWLSKANLVASATAIPSSSNPGTSPEDIRQFTPSSAPQEKGFRFSSQENGETPFRPTSSPTPRVRAKTSAPGDLDDDDDDEEDDITLDDALIRETARRQEKKKWAALKAQALQKQARPQSRRDEEDLDLAIISEAPTVPGQSARGVLHPTTSSSKQKALIFDVAGKRRTARPATKAFHHAAQQKGSRPSTAKAGHDYPVTQVQLATHLASQHHKQAYELQRRREEKFGISRPLPEKRALDLSTKISAATQASVRDSDDSDSDYSPEGDRAAEDENDDWNGDEEDAGSLQLQSPEAENSDDLEVSGVDADDHDKENRPVLASTGLVSDDDDDGPQPLKSRHVRSRVSFISDDEDDGGGDVRDQSLRNAVASSVAASTGSTRQVLSTVDIGEASFSQLFAETQQNNDDNASNGFDAIRNNDPKGLLPSQLLLPSVQISETQKRRDNALIAAEFDNEEGEAKDAAPAKQYLNSQGFFTQTRPMDHSSQLAPTAPASTMLNATSDLAPSSTMVNSTAKTSNPTSPIQTLDDELSLTRLRRRHRSPTPTKASPDRPLPSLTRNAFDVLHAGAARQATTSNRAHNSELIDAQAEESDDENGWGFAANEAEDDEEGDELGYVPELVDDVAVAEDVRLEQDALAAEKHREIAQADDERREAQAKKVTEGYYRHKRRGNEFMSDDEDEDGQPRRLTKKQRRQRKLDREDGLFKLGDESNVFLKAYEKDLESDDDFEETPLFAPGDASPDMALSARDRHALLRQRARMNTESTNDAFALDSEDTTPTFLIARATTRTSIIEAGEEEEVSASGARRNLTVTRSMESYSKFVSDESLNPRRNGGAGGVSVVVQRSSRAVTGLGNESGNQKSSRSLGNKPSGSILMNRGNRFA